MKIKTALLVCITFLLFVNCKNDDEHVPKENNEKLQILSFTFLANDNDHLKENVIGKIDHDKREILVTLPAFISLELLKPSITVSTGATIFPSLELPRNFSKPVTYKIIGDVSDTIVEYTVITSTNNSSESIINSFTILINNKLNPTLKKDLFGIIEENTIKLSYENGTNITTLSPTITISKGATIVPNDEAVQDFTNVVTYVVTAQDGITKTKYSIEAVQTISEHNLITSFTFSNINNVSYTAAIKGNNITLVLPEGTNLSSLTPTIEIGNRAAVLPESGSAIDFNELVTYEVTTKNGNKRIYTVNVYTENSLRSDRAVLEDFYEINRKNNLLLNYQNWDFNASTMQNWEGVTITDNRITGLSLSGFTAFRIFELPSSLGKLSKLNSLYIYNTNLVTIPKEIGELKELEHLTMDTNPNIKTLPEEIGDLLSLKSLNLPKNALETIPVGISNLRKLIILRLNDNRLLEISSKLAEIPNLLILNLLNNPMTIIPKEICAMKTENGLSIQLSLDIDDMCEL